MPVVRCPKHNIPYNTANPRGCPACWQENQGQSSDAEVMKQLARLSMGLPAIEELPPPPATPSVPPGEGAEGIPTQPPPGYKGPWPPPVTQQPRVPVPEPTLAQKLWRWARAHQTAAGAVLVLAIALPLIWIIAQTPFIADPQPPILDREARPLALTPNLPAAAAFSILGTAPPQAHPEARALARYQWTDGVTIDALNGVIYAVTLTTPARQWRGLRVGESETPTRGALTLLGSVREPPVGAQRSPILIDGYQVVSRLDERPIQRLIAEIRPPNGCMDVQVTLVPRAIGRLRQGDGDLWALARGTSPWEWVVGEVRIVSRAMPGPYAGRPDCDPPVAQPLPPGIDPSFIPGGGLP